MREIKFRAWDGEKNVMHLNVGFSFGDVGMQIELERPMLVQEGQYFTYPADHFELMQYTGLKDRNGMDVYEGDVLRSPYTEYSWTVEWCNEGAGFDIPHGVNECEIIGNVYEYKELLE